MQLKSFLTTKSALWQYFVKTSFDEFRTASLLAYIAANIALFWLVKQLGISQIGWRLTCLNRDFLLDLGLDFD